MAAFMKGIPPTLAVEFGRRAIPGNVRPSFQDLEKHIKAAAVAPLRAVPKRRPLRPRHRDGGTRRNIQIAVSLQCRDSSRDRRRLWPRQNPSSSSRRSGHGGHHGGAWKVAYADFVTAMMALFIVLWLLNSSQKSPESRRRIFSRSDAAPPKLSRQRHARRRRKLSSSPKTTWTRSKSSSKKPSEKSPIFDKLKNNIDMTVTNEGLRIELTESATGTFFDSGSTKISGDGTELLSALAGELGKLPNTIAMEGHTDSKPYPAASTYSNWELSSDRANAARRLMLLHGIRTDQVTQVRGFADQRLRKKKPLSIPQTAGSH